MNTVLTDSRVRRQDSSRQESRSGSAHYRMKGVSPKPGVRKAPAIAFAAAGQFSDFTYSGGPVIDTPQVSVLFVGDWSSSADQTRATNLQQFVSDMLNSDYMNILSQYGCGSSGSLVSSATVPSPDHDLSAADIHGILQSAIDNNLVPDASPSNAYILFLDNATAVDDTTTGAVMCEASSDTAFGYHYHFTTAGGANCYYAVVPSLTDSCLKNSCASDSNCTLHLSQSQEQRQTQVVSHELSEMFSDPEVGFNDAWTRLSTGDENGDICNGKTGTITVGPRTSTVQLMYSKSDDMSSNGATTCIASLPNPLPAFVPWRHLGGIPAHPLAADIDCSGLQQGVRSVTLADVDGDNQAEMIAQIDAAHSGGNDFWAMKYDPNAQSWAHLSPIPGHPLEADLDCSGLPNAGRAVSSGDVDGDGQAEVVVQIDARGSGGNDFWVMKFDPIKKGWTHLSQIEGHPLEADFDCSSLANAVRAFVVADVDGDGRAEVIAQIDAAHSGGNDFWVMKFDSRTLNWIHLSPIAGHPLQADFDCSGLPNASRRFVAGDVDGDGLAEVVLQIDAANSGGNDFWVMKFDPALRTWFHLSPIPDHPLQADFDCSGLPNAARSVALADVDGDGRAEVVVQIDAHGSGGNDFWVMKFVPPAFTPGGWVHLSPIAGHPLQADFDCSGLSEAAKSVSVGDIDSDGREEILLQIDAPGDGGNKFWAMKFDPALRTWSHFSPIPGHPLEADVACCALSDGGASVRMADVDGDGRSELVVQIQATGSGRNDFWVMDLP
jgi:hypothetical protein